MSENAQQNAPERCSCCTCGHTWVKGQHGGHSCAQVMEVTIADLRARLAKYEDAEGRPLQSSFPAEFLEHVKHARKELCRKETAPFHVRQRLAQKLTDCIAALKAQPPRVVLPEKLSAAIDWIDDFVARCNGDDRGSCESVNVIRNCLDMQASVGKEQLIDLLEAVVFTDVRRVKHSGVWHEELHQKAIDMLAHLNSSPVSAGDEAFCDDHCTWLDHHPSCDLLRAKVEDQALEIERLKTGLPGDTAADRLDSRADHSEPGSQLQSDLYAAATIWRKHLASLKAQPISVVDERAAFEAAVRRHHQGDMRHLESRTDEGYYVHHIQELWLIWQARAALSAPSHGEQVRDGWQLVPVEPNEAIRDAINLLCDDHSAFDDSDAFWSYLLAEAPSAGSQEQGE